MELTQLDEQKKRNVAFKLRIGDVLKAKPIINEGKFMFLELGEKKVVRVNIIANAVEKYVQDGEKKYATITIDDASGQIKLKAFGDDISILKDVIQGDTLQVVGIAREYNNELYLIPEVVKKVEPKWLLVRKLEIQKARESLPLPKNASLREVLLEKIKAEDTNGGIDVDKIIMETETNPSLINAEVKKLLEEGMIYEPRPGKLRYLG